MIKEFRKQRIAYTVFPFRQNQDLILVQTFRKNFPKLCFVASVVDGWSDERYIKGNKLGFEAGEFAAREFPKKFLESCTNNLKKRAEEAASSIDKEFLRKYPPYVATVGAFLFSFRERDIIVAEGSVVVFLWDGKRWVKSKEISDYSLDLRKYPSDVSRFWGRSELKNDPMYSCLPDVITIGKKVPVFLATDGLEKALELSEINSLSKNLDFSKPKDFLTKIIDEIKRKKSQRDDIAILLRY